MVNFADCVSKVQCRNLITNTPTKDGISALLKATTSVNKTSQNGFKLGGLPTVVQDSVMFSMGAKEKRTSWLQKFIKKGLLPNDKPFASEELQVDLHRPISEMVSDLTKKANRIDISG